MRRLLCALGCIATVTGCTPERTEPDGSTVPATAPTDIGTNPPDPALADIVDLLATAQHSGRADVQPTGNRVASGAGAFAAVAHEARALPRDRTAVWLLPTGSTSWYAVLDDGSAIEVTTTGGPELSFEQRAPSGTHDVDDAPPIVVDGTLVGAATLRSGFSDPLPDTRVVTDGSSLVALAGPTKRYPHGVLGDDTEASSVEIVRADGSPTRPIQVDARDVIEAVSPILADVNGDGELDIVVTVSNADVGARIVALSVDGDVIAESDPIGRGNRWLNLMAIAPIGPDGEVEIVAVRTPHIGGVLEFFRYDGSERLDRVATADGYSTHVIGSRNLDLGIVTDADGNGTLDVLLPTRSRDVLAIITRASAEASGTREVSRLRLSGELTTNVSAAGDRATGVSYAVGTSDGRIVAWPAPTPG